MKKSIELFYREGSSDKVYQATLEPEGSNFVVNFAFGRRGSTLKTGTKTSSPVGLEEAEKIFNKLVNEKSAKGYKQADVPLQSTYVTDKDQNQTGIHCQLLNPIPEEEIQHYVGDNDWCAQKKYDGKRCILKKDGDVVTCINRKGLSVGYPAAFDWVKQFDRSFIVDGEAVGDVLYIFDVLAIPNQTSKTKTIDVRGYRLYERLSYLNNQTILAPLFDKGSPFVRVQTYSQPNDKFRLIDNLKKSNSEGVVFKKLSSRYTPGRPASGGTHLKFKFYASSSFVVIGVNKKRSINVGLYDDAGVLVDVGNVTIPINRDVPTLNDIVEVQYLYAYRGGSIYQPIYLTKRTDIDLKDCTLKQLKYKPEEDDE